MKSTFVQRSVVGSLAALLCACAAQPTATTAASGTTPPPAAATTSEATTATRKQVAGVDYRRVVRNNVELFCRTELLTGSRTNAVETCSTQAQLDAAQKSARDMVDRVQQVPGVPSGPGGSGGAYNNVMTK